MSDVLAGVPFCLLIEHLPGGRFVVVAAGEADLYAAAKLDRSIRKCEDEGPKLVIVDLTDATLLDSTALGVLVAAHGRLAKQGVPLKLVSTNRLIRRVLTITGLDRVFEMHATSSAALDGQEPGGEGAALDVSPSPSGAARES